MMNERIPKEVFSQTEKFFKSACMLEPVRSVVHDSVATSRALHSRASAVALDGAKALTEVADTIWSSTKMLNDKVIQNATANAEGAFDAAQALAGARSFAEAATIQGEFMQQFAAKAAAQNKEFLDLFARAADHVIETAHAAASKLAEGRF
jgi:hypothetical protein